jgi:hypothetical protein
MTVRNRTVRWGAENSGHLVHRGSRISESGSQSESPAERKAMVHDDLRGDLDFHVAMVLGLSERVEARATALASLAGVLLTGVSIAVSANAGLAERISGPRFVLAVVCYLALLATLAFASMVSLPAEISLRDADAFRAAAEVDSAIISESIESVRAEVFDLRIDQLKALQTTLARRSVFVMSALACLMIAMIAISVLAVSLS